MKKLPLVLLLLATAAFGQSEPIEHITSEHIQEFREQVQQELGGPVKDFNTRLDELLRVAEAKKKPKLPSTNSNVDSMAIVRLHNPPSAPASAASPK